MGVNDLLERIADLDMSASDEPEIPPPELIGFIVRWGRGLRQWKRNTLADFAGVSLSTVERVERGEKVSEECLDRIAIALGYKRGDFTLPRRRRSAEEAAAELLELCGSMEVVNVRPLRTQSQVRALAKCGAFLAHRPGLEEDHNDDVALLIEWLDLASFVINTPTLPETAEGGRRRLYNDILACVQDLERRGVTVLAGVMNAPQEGLPDWKVAIISLTLKETDPGAMKRRAVFVDRRCVALPTSN